MTPFDKTSPLAENTGVIMWGASKIRHTSASIHCSNANRFFRLSASQITENAASPFCRNLTISRYFVSPNRLRKIHKRKSTAAPGECASQYTGCCHYRSPLFQATTVLQKQHRKQPGKREFFHFRIIYTSDYNLQYRQSSRVHSLRFKMPLTSISTFCRLSD